MKTAREEWEEYYAPSVKFSELFSDYRHLKDMEARSANDNIRLTVVLELIGEKLSD